MTNKTIVIVSYYYHPQITPRAFRAKELAAEFIRRKWSVVLITPLGVYENDRILDIHELTPSHSKSQNQASRPSLLKNILTKALRRLLPGGKDLLGALKIARHGLKTKINADVVISIGLPFSVHIATYFLRAVNSLKATRFIADYGDPYTAMEARYKGCLYAKYIERIVLRGFDDIAVPVPAAKVEFAPVTDINKIFVSPQGLDLTQFKLKPYREDAKKTRLAYAGLFYSDIRNPSVLFEHLNTLNKNIEFHIYTNLSHDATRQILEKYGTLENVIIHESLSREKCIYELSGYDFLVNIENEIQSQTPSKLIDYTIAQRPIFSLKSSNFDPDKFNAFVCKNYEDALFVDIAKFDIVTVTDNLISRHPLEK